MAYIKHENNSNMNITYRTSVHITCKTSHVQICVYI